MSQTALSQAGMNAGVAAAPTAPAIVRPSVRKHSFRIERSTPAIGAEITGLDFAEVARNKDLAAEIRALWLERRVLFFRQERIAAPELQAFAEQFGTLEPHPTAPMHPQAPLLLPLYRNVDDKPNVIERSSKENMWHSDLSCMPAPPRGAVLACELCPPTGGDTMWANMALAYERLPDRIKQRISGLYAKHSMEQYFGSQLAPEKRLKLAERVPATEHPVVVTHPETGEPVLYVNQPFTTHFSNYMNFDEIRYGQDFAEGANLLAYLKAQPQHPEFQVRLKWRPGTVAMWDNILCQHYAVADYGKEPRKMLRATLKGERLA